MRLIVIAALLLALLAAAAALTRPGPAQFDAMLDAALRTRLASTDVDLAGDAIPQIALAACKLRPTDCVSLVRQAIDVRFDRRLFTTRATVEGLRRSTTCIGAFGRFFCRRPIGE